ncbi:RHS repeat-associated core domain-containing protein [Stenotrophomonas bentonitica]
MTSQTYGYDAVGLWVQLSTDDRTCWRYWRGGRVVNEVRAANDGGGDVHLSWTGAQSGLLAEQVVGPGERVTLLAAAAGGSVLLEADTAVRSVGYAPHGHRDDTALAVPGFNGEHLDAGSGCYLLGAGHHRPYSPTLGLFLAPDSASPFSAGGLNTLAYCAGDPINRSDPSGHFWKWIGIAIGVVATVASLGTLAVVGVTASAVIGATLGVVGTAVEVAAAVVKDETASTVLSFVGLGVAAAGLVAAGPAMAKSAMKLGQKVARLSRNATGARAIGASGSSASKAGASWVQKAGKMDDIAAQYGASRVEYTVKVIHNGTPSRYANELSRSLARSRGYPLLSELSAYGRHNARANARGWLGQARRRADLFDFTGEEGLRSVQSDTVLARWNPNPPRLRIARTPAPAAPAPEPEVPWNIRPFSRMATLWDDVPPAYTDRNFLRFPAQPPAYDPGLPPAYPQGSPPPYNPNEFF